jgi:superfamily II DNA or RNA helicase
MMVSKQPLWTGAWAAYDYDEQLARRYRLLDRFEQPYLLYKSQNGKLFLPRAFCPVGEVDKRITGNEIDFDLKYPPRNPEQDRVIVETYEFLEAGQSGIVQAPTGFGKTYCACAVTALLRRPTLVVTTKDDLYEQWIEAANKFLGLPYEKIGRIRQNTCDVAGKPFVVGMIHSLAIEGKYPDWIKTCFGLVHFDEVQRLPADEFSKVAGMFASKWRVGWSATPDRADGREIVFFGHIGPVRVVSDAQPMIPEIFRYHTTYTLPLVPRRINGKYKLVKLPHQAGKVGHVISNMVKDEERNRLIAKLGSMCYKNGRQTVLFSDQREHLETLYGYLLALGVKSSDVAFYVGGIKKAEKEAAKTKPFLLATYNFMGEGTDVPTLDAAILSTPRSDVRQIVGRVIRSLDGKQTPIVFDLIDDDSPVFEAYASKRMKFYNSVGAKVTNVA